MIFAGEDSYPVLITVRGGSNTGRFTDNAFTPWGHFYNH